MSLHKHLWFLVIVIMCMAFGGSLIISTSSSLGHLEKQLQLSNIVHADTLALSLLRQTIDPATLRNIIEEHFASGDYRYIKITTASDEVLIEKNNHQVSTETPQWFTRLFALHVEPATVRLDGDLHSSATLTLQLKTDRASREMWHSVQLLFLYFFTTALLCGLVGNRFLQAILQPLRSAVKQAEAIGQRRFITIELPYTQEFHILAKSMNTLSKRVKSLLSEEALRLDQLRQDVEIDKVTKLLTRAPFLSRLESTIKNDDAASAGTFMILRIEHLNELNGSEGRDVVDTLLARFSALLIGMTQRYKQAYCGRLNGSDLAMVVPGHERPGQLATEINQIFLWIAKDMQLDGKVIIPSAAGRYFAGETCPGLLSRIDNLLTQAENKGGSAIMVTEEAQDGLPGQIEQWRQCLDQAFSQQQFSLASHLVSNLKGKVLHIECPVRLNLEKNKSLTAGQFLPWLNRLGWSARLDIIVLELAIEALNKGSKHAICINLSSQMLKDATVMSQIVARINENKMLAKRLWLEINEYGAYSHLREFKDFCQQLKPSGCHIGIEHIGPGVLIIKELHDVGIDYIKIDSALIRNIHNNLSSQIFVRGLCATIHSIGLIAIAEGVEQQEEWSTVKKMGIDAGTGPYFG